MAIVVMKFGGSSVADVDHLRRVAGQVVARQRQGWQVVVVVSAMGKTTDGLIAQARQVSPSPPRRELDMLVTAGERISMALLSMAISELGAESISYTGSQTGIITEDQHQGARIIEVRPERVFEALSQGRIVIVAGYQGVSRRREVTTLGRGGSDTTAVALAAALGAEACEIYSDVDGVYTADPNVCAQAQLLPQVGYEVMQAMASAGAKVLNADAVEFARRAGIVIHARKTGDTSGRRTLVSAEVRAPDGVVAVVGAAAVSRLVGRACEWWALDEEVAARGGRVVHAVLGPQLEVFVDRTGVPGRDAGVLAELAERYGLTASEVGLVSLVGSGLSGRTSLRARVQAELRELSPAALWVTDSALVCVLRPEQTEKAVQRLHAAFIEAAAGSVKEALVNHA